MVRAHLSKIHKLTVVGTTDAGRKLVLYLSALWGSNEIPVRAAVADKATRLLANMCSHLPRLFPDLEEDLGRAHLGVVFETEYVIHAPLFTRLECAGGFGHR